MVIKIIAMSVYHRVNGACSSHLRWIRNPNQYTMHARWLDIRKWYSIQRYSSKCYPSETCHINQELWIYQKMIEYGKIWCCLMSRTDPILMAKNGKNCLQFFKPRRMLQLPLLEKKCTISHSIPMLNFLMETSPDLPLARPHSTADPGPWPFCSDSKNDSIGDLKIQRFLRWNGRIWHHTEGLAVAGWRSGILMNIACSKWKYVEMM